MNGVELKNICKNMRLDMLKLTHALGRKGAHIATSLSMTEIIASLFLRIMDKDNDIFILSKGHGGMAYYCGLKEAGIITADQLMSFDTDGGDFPGQPSKNEKYHIIYSSGSLGLGLSYGAGRALALKSNGKAGNVFVLMGDGELNEGSVWETAMFAKHHGLNNLIAVVDRNNMQSDGATDDIMSVDLEAVWRGFGWKTVVCDGHDVDALFDALMNLESLMPTVILAKTIKGKGVSFMENDRAWHHGALTDELYERAIKEVESELL